MSAVIGPPRTLLLRLLLLLAAVDTLLSGTWAILRPGDLFTWLHLPPTRDGLLLCRAFGALTLCQVPCLMMVFLRPQTWAGATTAPLLGRSLSAGIWLWLLNADRVHPAVEPLRLLLLHDVVWLPVFVAFLFRVRVTPASGPASARRFLARRSPPPENCRSFHMRWFVPPPFVQKLWFIRQKRAWSQRR